jgi:hypothetical protein
VKYTDPSAADDKLNVLQDGATGRDYDTGTVQASYYPGMVTITTLSGAQLGWGSTQGQDNYQYVAGEISRGANAVVKNITATSVVLECRM